MAPPPLVDGHCHVHDPRLESSIEHVLQRAIEVDVLYLCSCGCHPEDWSRLVQLMEKHHQSPVTILPSFGYHPWWANVYEDESLLRDMLLRFPTAGLGEIGLCKSSRGQQITLNEQMRVFQAQFELGIELKRTMTIHCVGYHGQLLSYLQQQYRTHGATIPSVILHSFSGSFELMRDYAKLSKHIYFSFSVKQICTNAKVQRMLPRVPVTQLMLETDAPDQSLDRPPSLNEPSNIQKSLEYITIQNCYPSLTKAGLAEQLQRNASTAFTIK